MEAHLAFAAWQQCLMARSKFSLPRLAADNTLTQSNLSGPTMSSLLEAAMLALKLAQQLPALELELSWSRLHCRILESVHAILVLEGSERVQ